MSQKDENVSKQSRVDDLTLMQALDDGHVDILGNGMLKKKVLKMGDFDKGSPEKGNQVFVHYRGTLLRDGSQFDSSYDRNESFNFQLGLGQVIKGWDEGVATMHWGEKAILTCSPEYAYGANGSPPKIPPNAVLQFEVELLKFEDDFSGKSLPEKLIEVAKQKESGNSKFKTGNFNGAIANYNRGLDLLISTRTEDEDEAEQIEEAKKPLNLNISMAYLNVKEYDEAITHATKVIEIDDMNTKAYYRRGCAYKLKNKYDEAKRDFRKVLELDPSNKAAKKEMGDVQTRIKEYRKKEREIYKNIFSDMK